MEKKEMAMFSDAVLAAGRIAQVGVDLGRRDSFLAMLVFNWQVMVASEGLLQEAADRSGGELRGYLLEHLEEERGHARWLAEDLLGAGIEVRKAPLFVPAVELVGGMYYRVRHQNPVSLLGYMVVLEQGSMQREHLSILEGIYGKGLCRTLRHHVEEDPGHLAELLRAVDRFPDACVLDAAMATAEYIGRFLTRLGSVNLELDEMEGVLQNG